MIAAAADVIAPAKLALVGSALAALIAAIKSVPNAEPIRDDCPLVITVILAV